MKLSIIVKSVGLVLVGASLNLGCNANPYVNTGTYLQQAPVPEPVQTVEFLSAPDSVEFSENVTGEVNIGSKVTFGSPIVSVVDLPRGAVFDSATQKITWKPTHDDALDRANPFAVSKTYKVRVILRSTVDDKAILKETSVFLVVNLTPGSLSVIKVDEPQFFVEGKESKAVYQVLDQDYPKGPFTIAADSRIPPGVAIAPSATDQSRFEIKYKPGVRTVINKSYNTCDADTGKVLCEKSPWGLKVVNPRGYAFLIQFNWTVLDVRQDPVVTFPESVPASGLNARFHIYAEDPNAEEQPTIVVEQPETGVVLTKVLKTTGAEEATNPSTYMQVDWVGNMPNVMNTSKVLKFKVCIGGDASAQDQLRCVLKEINVLF